VPSSPGCHHLGSRLKQLNGQAIGALALALEIGSVIGCGCFEPRDPIASIVVDSPFILNG
jgi:hypothetical protein